MKKSKMKLVFALMALSTTAHASVCDDSALKEVMDVHAKSFRQVDFRIADDLIHTFVRIGDRIYTMAVSDGELQVEPIFGGNSVAANDVKSFCKNIECDSALKEVAKGYRGLLFSSSKMQRKGLAAMRFSDDLKSMYVRLGDRVYAFASTADDEMKQVEIFGKSSWTTGQIQQECSK